jgi:hypothetical protein
MDDTFGCPSCGTLLRRSPAMTAGVHVKCPKCQLVFPVPAAAPAAPPKPVPPPAAPPKPVAPRKKEPEPIEVMEVDEDQTPIRRRQVRTEPKEEPVRRKPAEEEKRPAPRSKPQPAADSGNPFDFGGEPDAPAPARGRAERTEDDRDSLDFARSNARADTRKKLNNEYKISVGAWFRHGSSAWGSVVGPILGYYLLMVALFALAFGAVWLVLWIVAFAAHPDGLSVLLVLGAIYAAFLLACIPLPYGPLYVCVRQIRGQPWGFGDLWQGYKIMGSVIGFSLFMGLFSVAAAVLSWIASFVLALMMAGVSSLFSKPGDELSGVTFLIFVGVIGLVNLVIYAGVLFMQVRFLFTPFLMLDRRYDLITAISGSFKMTEGHSLGLFGMSLLLMLVAFSGYLGLGICILLTVPLAMCILSAGYVLATGENLDAARAVLVTPLPDDEEEERPAPKKRRRPADDD